jgi:hypothetical protein
MGVLGTKRRATPRSPGGRLEVLQWARARGCDWSETCTRVAGTGQLEVLRWACAQGCPWDDTAYCAANGHLKVLQRARVHDCP